MQRVETFSLLVVVATVFTRSSGACVILYNLQVLIVKKEKELLEEQLEESLLL